MMNYKELVNPELRQSVSFPPYNKFQIFIAKFYLAAVYKLIPVPKSLSRKSINIEGYKNRRLKMDVFEPAACSEKLPCLLFVHGGAFSYKASPHHKQLAMLYAQQVHCRVIFPDYHLSPKYPYPAAYQDVVAAYRYIVTRAKKLKIDLARIGVTGDSAGAMLAALLCSNCTKFALPVPCLQMLVYPVTGVNTATASMAEFTDTPVWNARHTRTMWKYYFKNGEIDYAGSPMHNDTARNMPPTYIETCQYDCLHDDGVLYAEKLKKSGASVQLNQTEGTFHGYDAVLNAQITQTNIQKRIDFLTAVLHGDLM